MSTEPLRYPVLQIRPYGFLAYDRVEWPTTRHNCDRHNKFSSETGKGQYNGILTEGARKRLKRAIQLITAAAVEKPAYNSSTGKHFKFKLNFITLTLPAAQGDLGDKEIKKQCLEPFLLQARRWFKLCSYIWRAERQKNGNIHFHIVSDTFIPYDQLRDLWNLKLNNLQLIDKFEAKHGHRHPNSTDVHAIHTIRNLAAYFSKYMAKGERTAEQLWRVPFARQIWHEKLIVSPGQKYKRVLTREESRIDGKLWDCSKNLKTSANCEMILEGEQLQLFSEAVADETVTVKRTDQFTVVLLNARQFKKYVRGTPLLAYNQWLAVIRKIPAD